MVITIEYILLDNIHEYLTSCSLHLCTWLHGFYNACRLRLSTDKAIGYRAVSNNSQENICG